MAPSRFTLSSAVLGASLCAWGCNGPPPGAPSPVIVATPTSLCLGDDYKTPIVLDGTQSSPTLTLVPTPPAANAPPLAFAWTLTGSAYRIVRVDAGGDATRPSGSLTSDKLTVTMAADQPLQVDLHVENPQNGGSADTTTTISVTPLNDAGACPLGNPG